MKTIVFVTGVAVGAIATVGTAVGVTLFGMNSLTKGGVSDILTKGLADIKNAMFEEKQENGSCDSPSDS